MCHPGLPAAARIAAGGAPVLVLAIALVLGLGVLAAVVRTQAPDTPPPSDDFAEAPANVPKLGEPGTVFPPVIALPISPPVAAATNPRISVFPIPSFAISIVAGQDGAIWFTSPEADAIGRITPDGSSKMFFGATIKSPMSIAPGQDGAMWFVNGLDGSIGRVTTAGEVTNVGAPTVTGATRIVAGPDGALWFTVAGTNDSVGRITTGGVLTTFTAPGISSPAGMTAGPDGAMWFGVTGYSGSLGRVSANDAITQIVNPRAHPWELALGPDRSIWFTNGDVGGPSIGRITP